jgi:hypothetical protein
MRNYAGQRQGDGSTVRIPHDMRCRHVETVQQGDKIARHCFGVDRSPRIGTVAMAAHVRGDDAEAGVKMIPEDVKRSSGPVETMDQQDRLTGSS